MKKTIALLIFFIPLIMNTQTIHNMTISKLIFTENGTRLYSSSFDSNAILWDIQNNKGLKKFGGQRGFMTSLALSEKHNILLTSARDMTIVVRNLGGETLRTINAHRDSVNYVIIRDNIAVSASDNGEIIFWQFPSMKQIKKLLLNINGIDVLFFSPDSKLLIAGCVDGKIRIINAGEKRILKTVKIHDSFILTGTFINENILITGSSDGVLSFYDVKEQVIKKKIVLTGESILSLIKFKEKLYVGTKTGMIYVINSSDYKILSKNKLSNAGINALAINDLKSIIAAGDDLGVIRVLSIENLTLIKTLGH
jgi:WD40 repeat protein